MMELFFKTRYTQASQHRSSQNQASPPDKGFTLIELLIVVLIASGIISGLMFMVVELLTADQKDASRNQTQQEMQMSLDYISAELRQAVYVYDEACLSTTAVNTVADETYCPGLANHLPAQMNDGDTKPVLAFWKQQQLPSAIRDACGAGSAIANTPCISGHAYSLVVYASDTSDSNIWDGQSRLKRYTLDKYDVAADDSYGEAAGYVDPSAFGSEFRSWPYYQGTGDATRVNKQATSPVNESGDVLVDFVDSVARETPSCPTDYSLSAPAGNITGFFACVSDDDSTNNNRDLILSIRGNAYGRPAIGGQTAFLPMLETHVLSRPVLDKTTTE